MNRQALNPEEEGVRGRLRAMARAMLKGEIPYLEGAPQVLALRELVGGVAEADAEFEYFALVTAETAHLPLDAQRPLWSTSALAALEPERARAETWARERLSDACRRLIVRFGA